MANVIDCPKCHQPVSEAHASFDAGTEPHTFRVTHLDCRHTWTAHHRDFYPSVGPRPRPRNPFEPVRLIF